MPRKETTDRATAKQVPKSNPYEFRPQNLLPIIPVRGASLSADYVARLQLLTEYPYQEENKNSDGKPKATSLGYALKFLLDTYSQVNPNFAAYAETRLEERTKQLVEAAAQEAEAKGKGRSEGQPSAEK